MRGLAISGRLAAVCVLAAAMLAVAAPSAAEIIVHQDDAVLVGPWRSRDDDPGNFANTFNGDGTHFLLAGEAGTATSTATLSSAGNWSVEMWMPSRSATDNALLSVEQGGESTQFRLNQSDGAARWSGNWLSLGVYDFEAGEASVVLDNEGASGGGHEVASMTGAVRFAQLDDGVTPFVLDSILGPVGSEGEFFERTQGSWITSDSDAGMEGPHWGSHRLSDSEGAEAVFAGMPLARGLYELDIRWGAGSNRTDNALLTIIDADEVAHEFTINQQEDPSDIVIDGWSWDQIGTFDLDFAGGISEIRLSSDDRDYLSADAVRLTYIPEPATLGLLGIGGLAVLLRRRRS